MIYLYCFFRFSATKLFGESTALVKLVIVVGQQVATLEKNIAPSPNFL